MTRHPVFTLLIATLLLSATVLAQGPVITDVSPQAASPGDEITIKGTFPLTITHTQFTATVGGFVGIDNKIAVVTSATATQVKVTVPTMAGFAPPNATPPGAPLGTLRVRDAGGTFSATFTFFFNQGSHRDPNGLILQVESIGLGSTSSLGCRAATSFDVSTGPPNTAIGNPNFQLTLENATPFSQTVLLVGTPPTPPTLAIGDGLLAIDLAFPVIVHPPAGFFIFTDANGEFSLDIAIPVGPFGVPLSFVYAYFDNGAAQFQIATGLQINL